MRAFRVGAGAVLAVVGLVVCVAGAVTAFWIVGPDDVLSLRPHSFRGEMVAVTSRPDLLDYYGSRAVVTVEPARGDRAVFIGVGHDIDVRSYLDTARHTRVSKVGYPSSVSATDVSGTQTHVLPPAALDWWVAKVSGTGRQTLRWKLADGPYDLVVMRADGEAGLDLEATFGLEVRGAFGSSLLVLTVGAVFLAGGVLLTGWLPRRRRGDDDDGELDWDGRELWAQNEYWTSSEQAARTGGVLVPGDAPPDRMQGDDEPARVVSMRGREGPPWQGSEGPRWQIGGVPAGPNGLTGPGGPGGPEQPIGPGGQRVYASDAPARAPKMGAPPPGPTAGPPSHRPGGSGPQGGPSPSPHVSPSHIASPNQGGPFPAPDSFTAPGPGGPVRPSPDPSRRGDPPARPPWRPAGTPRGAGRANHAAGPGPVAGPGHAAGRHGSRRVDPQPAGPIDPDVRGRSDFPSFEPDQAEPPPWLPGPVGQPFALPSEPRDPGDQPVRSRGPDGDDPSRGPRR